MEKERVRLILFTYIDVEVGPLGDVTVGVGWRAVQIQDLPEVSLLLALMDEAELLVGAFVLLEQTAVLLNGLHVSLVVAGWDFGTDPAPE